MFCIVYSMTIMTYASEKGDTALKQKKQGKKNPKLQWVYQHIMSMIIKKLR